MKALFTGATSFTGMWFARELALAGFQVTAPLLRKANSYSGTRKIRLEIVAEHCRAIQSCPFGSDAFFDLIESGGPWDIFCHHASEVTNYKNPDFDYIRALQSNTCRVKEVLDALGKNGCRHILLTGTVFEPGEGEGSDNLRAVSPYGLSKGLTSEVFRYWAQIEQWSMGKFVVPNPFGPYEEERFTSYLMRTWMEGKEAPVSSPSYVRDNIHVSLLAKAYKAFAQQLFVQSHPYIKTNPSGYVEEQGSFTARFAAAMADRLKIDCRYRLLKQTEFPEPLKRYNTDPVSGELLNWNEKEAWDEIADYYASGTKSRG